MKGSQCRIHLRQWCADLYPSEATVLRCMDLRYIGGQDSRISWLFQPKMAIIDISLYLYIYSILSGDPKVLIFRQSKNKTIRTLRCTFFWKLSNAAIAPQHRPLQSYPWEERFLSESPQDTLVSISGSLGVCRLSIAEFEPHNEPSIIIIWVLLCKTAIWGLNHEIHRFQTAMMIINPTLVLHPQRWVLIATSDLYTSTLVVKRFRCLHLQVHALRVGVVACHWVGVSRNKQIKQIA
jgi:hypothetical protein